MIATFVSKWRTSSMHQTNDFSLIFEKRKEKSIIYYYGKPLNQPAFPRALQDWKPSIFHQQFSTRMSNTQKCIMPSEGGAFGVSFCFRPLDGSMNGWNYFRFRLEPSVWKWPNKSILCKYHTARVPCKTIDRKKINVSMNSEVLRRSVTWIKENITKQMYWKPDCWLLSTRTSPSKD